MPEQGEITKPPEQKLTPIGERILGIKDPKKLSKDDFQKSPELLYHVIL